MSDIRQEKNGTSELSNCVIVLENNGWAVWEDVGAAREEGRQIFWRILSGTWKDRKSWRCTQTSTEISCMFFFSDHL